MQRINVKIIDQATQTTIARSNVETSTVCLIVYYNYNSASCLLVHYSLKWTELRRPYIIMKSFSLPSVYCLSHLV